MLQERRGCFRLSHWRIYATFLLFKGQDSHVFLDLPVSIQFPTKAIKPRLFRVRFVFFAGIYLVVTFGA